MQKETIVTCYPAASVNRLKSEAGSNSQRQITASVCRIFAGSPRAISIKRKVRNGK